MYTKLNLAWESLGLQGDPTSPFWRRSVLGFLWKECSKAETPVRWPPHAKSWLFGKDSDAGRDWGQEEKGTTEDEMAGWHHWRDGHESEWTPGVGDGQGGLACCDSWSRKEWDTTERLNWTELTTNNNKWASLSCSKPCAQSLSRVQLFTILWTVAIHGISQARTLEWAAISSSRGSSWPRNQTYVSCVSCVAGRFFFTCWAIREAPQKLRASI